ncbi:YdbC family protein [Loigolactobacillus zhaoyuanensis]|uniref:YdbC family protein n=1 Tax=Loigolactobacillus zhaoyuanensis TaxID=2486017 RepID=A0ABW8UAG4_9LACO|nr:YdbC family protein [Loigolactobacillus zhaoyuanensis]
MAAPLQFTIEETVGVLSTSKSGWTRELNLVSWNDRPAKFDLRDWSPDHSKMGKGITLTNEEIDQLRQLLTGMVSD